MGEDEVIVSHADSGAIQVLLNKCRHRGTIVCRDDKGNSSHFRCPYHGWTYANDGSWTGAPKRARAYQNLDPDQWGLLRAPRVIVRWGLIFACLDEEAPSFEDFAGDALWYLDCFLGLDSRGLVALGEPNRWVARTNWKSGSENIGGDNYHVPTAHASCTEVGVLPDLREANEENAQFETGNGHVFTANRTFFASVGLAPFGHSAAVWDSFDKKHVDERHLELHEKYFVFTGTFFPNFSVFKAPGNPDPVTGHVPIYTMLRLWQPAGPHKTEVWNWICAYEAEPEEHRDAIYAAGMLTLGPAGMLEQDDMAVWEGTTAAGASVMAERLGMKFNYQLGLDGMSAGGPLADFPGPGTAVDKSYNEGNQRAFMRQWARMMEKTT
jgi:phenylpropionate dioxygenase-like ring-hydroxylating dioxygenase large terminal subunit